MNIFSKVLETWTHYELIMLIGSILLLTVGGITSVWYFIRDKRSLFLAIISSISTLLIVVLTIFVSNLIGLSISEENSFIFLLTTTISVINLATLNNFLVKHRNRKDFDIDFVTREHFSDSLKLIFFICLFFSILIAFTNGEIRNIIIGTGISSILAISFNHLLARIFFKDRKSE